MDTMLNASGEYPTLGSWKKTSHFFEGYMMFFAYGIGHYVTGSEIFDNVFTSAGFTVAAGAITPLGGSAITLDYCDHGEWNDSPCTACDPTCTNGCADGTSCSPCHSSCLTCTAGDTGAEECLTCKLGAELSNSSATKSSCVCKSGYIGNADHCTPICKDEGCLECTSTASQECEVCDEFHELNSTGNGTCNFCTDTPDLLYSIACLRNHRRPSNDCTCPATYFFDPLESTR